MKNFNIDSEHSDVYAGVDPGVHSGKDVVIGALIGAAGGLIGAWVMEKTQMQLSNLMSRFKSSSSDSSEDRSAEADSSESSSDPATVQMANWISEGLLRHELRDEEKGPAGEAVHYMMGASMGALYGVLAALDPRARAGLGLPFGTAVFAIADEGMVPVLGFSKSPMKVPLSTHAYALASHLAFGASLYASERGLRKAFGQPTASPS